MGIIINYLNTIKWENIILTSFRVFLILLGGWIAMKIVQRVLLRLEHRLLQRDLGKDEPPSESAKRVDTIIRLVRQATFITLWLTVLLVVLKELGFEIGPILASAGIVGVAIGFGAQNLVRDVISGFFVILENQIRVGDVAIINNTGGLVEKINFRTTVLRDLGGVVHVFPNGTITTLSNLTNEWSAYVFEIGVAYKENTDEVIAVMKKVGEEFVGDVTYGPFMLEPPEIFGVDKLDNSAVVIKGRIRTRPIRQWQVGREYLRRVKLAFDAQDIEIPFPHRTIYFGGAGKPLAVQVEEKSKEAATA